MLLNKVTLETSGPAMMRLTWANVVVHIPAASPITRKKLKKYKVRPTAMAVNAVKTTN